MTLRETLRAFDVFWFFQTKAAKNTFAHFSVQSYEHNYKKMQVSQVIQIDGGGDERYYVKPRLGYTCVHFKYLGQRNGDRVA